MSIALGARQRTAVACAVGAVFFAGSAVVEYDAVSEADGISLLDRPVLAWMMSHRSPIADQVITGFTDLGGPVGMTCIAVVITALLVWRGRSATPAIVMAIAVSGSLILTNRAKAIIGRSRPPAADAVPPLEHGFSLPSGHTLNSTVIAGVVAFLIISRRTGIATKVTAVLVAALWAAAMGMSRVFLGHHWFTDVIFGWSLGLTWLMVVIIGYTLLKRPVPSGAVTPG